MFMRKEQLRQLIKLKESNTYISNEDFCMEWTLRDAQTLQEFYTQTISIEILEIGITSPIIAAMRTIIVITDAIFMHIEERRRKKRRKNSEQQRQPEICKKSFIKNYKNWKLLS